MTDPLYAVDPTALSLVELPAQVPNLLTYTLRRQQTNGTTLEAMLNFTGVELAVLYVRVRGQSLNGTGSTTTAVEVRINGTAFASVTIPAVGASGTSYAPLWSFDPDAPTLVGVNDELELTSSVNTGAIAAADICMIPSSQLSLLGS